jgi:3-dehydroquinate dehydratase-2
MARIPHNTPAGTIYVLNGPNPGPSGSRVPETRLADVEKRCAEAASKFGLRADCRQSGGEAELIEFIREAQANQVAGIVLNAGGYSRGSIALHEALMATNIPAIEVQIDNHHAHDHFRDHSFTAKAACATLTGFGIDGYRLAITGLAAKIGVPAAA